MRDKKSHKLWSRLTKFIAVTLALVLIVGVLPASAASGEIVVKTKKQLVKAMEKKSAATIIFRTNRKTRFIIPEIENSANKKLVMEAPNARAFNKATFKTITLNKSEYFNERGNDNSLYIKGDGVKLTVSKGIEAKKVSITATDVIVKVASDGNVGDIICNKKAAEITVAVAKNAEANITIKKQADLIVAGDKTADITIVSQAADTKITATAPVDIVAEKDVDVVLEKGSEGSTVESSKEVDVDISGAAEKQATVTEDGKVVQEAEPAKEEEKKDTTPAKDTTPSATDNNQSSGGPGPGSSSGGGATQGNENTGKVKITFTSSVTGGTVAVTQGGNSLYTGDGVATGSSITIKLTPASGYEVGGVSIDPTSAAGTPRKIADGTWEVSGIIANLTIVATFNLTASGSNESVMLKAAEHNGPIGTATGTAVTYTFKLKESGTEKASVTVTVASGASINTATSGAIVISTSLSDADKQKVKEVDFSVIPDDYFTENIVAALKVEFVNLNKVYKRSGSNTTISVNGVTVEEKSQQVN